MLVESGIGQVDDHNSWVYLLSEGLDRLVTPHGTTGEAPSMLFFGRRIRTRLDLLVPSVNSKVERSQNRIISCTDRGSRNFETGDAVLL